MMIKHLMIATMLFTGAACDDNSTDTQPKPNCPEAGVVLTNFDDLVPCDLEPPQVLMVLIDDMNDLSQLQCDLFGGRILSDGTSFICSDLDY